MRDVVICAAMRTPVGKFGGAFRSVSAGALGSAVLQEMVSRWSIPDQAIDDVIVGQCYPNGEEPALGRVVALDAGLDVAVPGLQLDRRCGSGLQSVLYAAMAVQTEAMELVLAGGAESMSGADLYSVAARWGSGGRSLEFVDRLARARVTAGGWRHPVEGGMIATAENLRRQFAIPRIEQDELAVESHRRAVAAQDEGRFDDEIVPVPAGGGGGARAVSRDEHPRPDANLEALAALTPMMLDVDADATVTAGNASGQNDAAALCIVTSRARAEQLGLEPMARLVSWACAGVAPQTMGVGPVPATGRALKRAGLTLADIDLLELNEAFAVQVLAVTRQWEFGAGDFARLNVNGSGISLGHPAGATGARILTTLLHEMGRREVRYGLVTMCIGGGQGLAAIFERVAG